MAHPRRLRLSWQPGAGEDFSPDAFLGAWIPRGDLEIDFAPTGRTRSIAASNWFAASHISPCEAESRGLVHAFDSDPEALCGLAFRGYLLTPPIHMWCDSAEIWRYWRHPDATHNGIFAAVRISRGGRRAELISDALGISPLYYRVWNGVLLFATSARLLAAPGDRMDRLAGRALIQMGYVCGNRSLTAGVRRVPPGSRLIFDSLKPVSQQWFAYTQLPGGERPICRRAVREVEECFQQSIDRCLRLRARDYVLPLSSGYDSRRILAALHSRKAAFQALTVRVLQKDNRDLDGYWAAAMARHFKFSHRVIELPTPEQYREDDRIRRLWTDSEVTEHTWGMQLSRRLPGRTSLIFDGLGGDVLNNTGYGVAEFHTAPEHDKLQLIARHMVDDRRSRVLTRRYWPEASDLRGDLIAYLAGLPAGRNLPDLAFLLVRTRRGAGMWSQATMPAGHVPVHPYCDLDYIRVSLRYDPLHKLERRLQDRCLEEFWPAYFAFPGSRRLPPDSKPGDPGLMRGLNLACLTQLQNEAEEASFRDLKAWLTWRGYVLLRGATHQKWIAHRCHWWMYPILSLHSRKRSTPPCWTSVNQEGISE